MMLRIPIRKGADKAIIGKGEKVAMCVVMVNRQVAQGMQNHTDKNDFSNVPPAKMRDRCCNNGEGNGVKQSNNILKTRLPITLAPNLTFGLFENEFRPEVKQKDWQIGKNGTGNNR